MASSVLCSHTPVAAMTTRTHRRVNCCAVAAPAPVVGPPPMTTGQQQASVPVVMSKPEVKALRAAIKRSIRALQPPESQQPQQVGQQLFQDLKALQERGPHNTQPLPAQQQPSLLQELRPPQIDQDMLDLDFGSPDFAPRDYPVAGRVLVCQGSKCRAKGALGVLQAVSAVTSASNDTVQVLPCKCLGKCRQGAVVRVKQQGVPGCATYTQVSPQDVPAMLDAHFMEPLAPGVTDALAADMAQLN